MRPVVGEGVTGALAVKRYRTNRLSGRGLPLTATAFAEATNSRFGVMVQEARKLFLEAIQEFNAILSVDYSRVR